MTTIMVTGGAGYVGSQTVLYFREQGWRVLIYDDFSTGHRAFAEFADRCFEGDTLDREALIEAFTAEPVDGVVHCAARALVAESVARPEWYFRQNILGTLNVIDAARAAGDAPVVFSSSATVYGEPSVVPTPLDHPKAPINPYGFSKWASEQALQNASVAYGLRSVSLRYFNAAGADPDGRAGEDHTPETHAIPNLIGAALGTRPPFELNGDDYPTRDGTCVRDFVHTLDIARAHFKSLEYLLGGGTTTAFNIGTSGGISIGELLKAVSDALGKPVPMTVAPRRPGDAASLVADPSQTHETLGWRPIRSDAETIIGDALAWHRRAR